MVMSTPTDDPDHKGPFCLPSIKGGKLGLYRHVVKAHSDIRSRGKERKSAAEINGETMTAHPNFCHQPDRGDPDRPWRGYGWCGPGFGDLFTHWDACGGLEAHLLALMLNVRRVP